MRLRAPASRLSAEPSVPVQSAPRDQAESAPRDLATPRSSDLATRATRVQGAQQPHVAGSPCRNKSSGHENKPTRDRGANSNMMPSDTQSPSSHRSRQVGRSAISTMKPRDQVVLALRKPCPLGEPGVMSPGGARRHGAKRDGDHAGRVEVSTWFPCHQVSARCTPP